MENYSLIEDRLEEANAIKDLLKKSFIPKSKKDSDAYLRVESKIQEFLRSELEILLGIKVKEVKGLDEDEVGALKVFASRLTNKEAKPMETKTETVQEAVKEEKEFVEFEVNGELFKKETSVRGQTLPVNYAPPSTGEDQYHELERQMSSRSMGNDFSSQIQSLFMQNTPLVDEN